MRYLNIHLTLLMPCAYLSMHQPPNMHTSTTNYAHASFLSFSLLLVGHCLKLSLKWPTGGEETVLLLLTENLLNACFL